MLVWVKLGPQLLVCEKLGPQRSSGRNKDLSVRLREIRTLALVWEKLGPQLLVCKKLGPQR